MLCEVTFPLECVNFATQALFLISAWFGNDSGNDKLISQTIDASVTVRHYNKSIASPY